MIVAIVFLSRPKLYESITTFTLDVALAAPPSREPAAGQSPHATAQSILAYALERANDPPPTDPAVRREFAVDLLRNLQLQLVCRAERPELSEQICQRTGIEALARFPVLQQASAPRQASLASVHLRDIGWPALLLGLGWFLVRSSGFNPRRAGARARAVKDALREAQRWWLPNRAPLATPAPRTTPSIRRARTRPATVGVKTLVGMPVAGSAAAAPVVSAPAAQAAFTSPPPPSAAPRREDTRRPDVPSGTATHVIYHVSKGSWVADPDVLRGSQIDQLRELCARLSADTGAGCRVVRVASGSASRYAKSQVAAQLAALLAERGDTRVLLMEGDLDEPALHRLLQLNVPRGMGLSEQLERMASAESASNTATIVRLTAHLHALVESRWGTPSLLDSAQFASVLARQRNENDVIVLDGPIIDTWADAQVLKGAVDKIVFVVASGTSLADALQLAHSHFDSEAILSIVRTGEWADA